MKDKRKKLIGMTKVFLLINPQSESADQNVRQLIDLLDDQHVEQLYDLIRPYLKAKLEQQIDALQDQIESMEE